MRREPYVTHRWERAAALLAELERRFLGWDKRGPRPIPKPEPEAA